MYADEGVPARSTGGITRADAEMSSESRVRIPTTENPRVPGPGESAQGKSEPNMRPKGVVDGRQVNIPVLDDYRLTDGVTEKDSVATCWKWWFKRVGGIFRQIRRSINTET